MHPNTAASTMTLVIILYHTKGNPPKDISLPNMPVHPAKNTAMCSIIRVKVFSLISFLDVCFGATKIINKKMLKRLQI